METNGVVCLKVGATTPLAIKVLGVPMLIQKKLALELSEAAMAEVGRGLARSDFDSPIPGILFGTWNNNPEQTWVVGIYNQEKLPPTGYILETPHVRFYTFQEWIIEKLAGRKLDFIDGRYVVR